MKDEAKLIADALEFKVDPNDPESIKAKIIELTLLSATCAALQANARKLLRQKQLEVLKEIDKSLPASIQSKTIDAECWEEDGWQVYVDRLSAGISHSIDGLRSTLSFIKTEMQNLT